MYIAFVLLYMPFKIAIQNTMVFLYQKYFWWNT